MTASPEVFPLGIQGSHAGLGISNQGPVASILPTSGANASLQGSSGIVLSSNLASPSGPLNPPVRYMITQLKDCVFVIIFQSLY